MKKEKKRSTVTKKLTTRITVFVSVILLVVISASYIVMRNTVGDLSEELLEKEAASYEKETDAWVTNILSTFTSVQQTILNVNFKDDDELLAYLATTETLNEAVPTGAYIGGENNRFVDASGWVPDSDYVVAERDWYILGLEGDTLQFGDPYISEDTDAMAVSASATLTGKDVVAIDVSLEDMTNMIKEIKVLDNGYAFLVDQSSNTILAHSNSEYEGKTIEETNDSFLTEAGAIIADNDQTIHQIKDKDGTYLVKCNQIEGTDWILVSCADYDAVYSEVNSIQVLFVIIGILSILAAIVLLTVSIRRVMKPIVAVTSDIGQMSQGDFTMEVEIKGNDEITTMSEGIVKFLSYMCKVIKELLFVSSKLKTQSESCVVSSDRMSESTQVQTEAMGQLKTTVNDMAKSTEEIAVNATNLANSASGVNMDVDDASKKMKNAVNVTERGKQDVEEVSNNMQRINLVMNQLQETVGKVESSMAEINNITDIIGDIAERTNLLALNASIEAARAGEAGSGFAVVATEIGTLASSSTDSVGQIAALIGTINGEVKEVVEKTKESVQDIVKSNELMDNTKDTFALIDQTVLETEKLIDQIKDKVIIVDGVSQDMAAITEEQSASTEEILSTLENMYEQSIHITEASKEVKEIANYLEETADTIGKQMGYFKIEK